MKVLIGFVAALISPVCAAPPEFLFDTWQTEDGLPQNTIRCITQTRDGYLWFGTFDGLVRFDGIRFEIFTPNNSPGLSSGNILCLFADRQGRLWIGTDGEGVVYLERGTFHPIQGTPEANAMSRVYQITQLPDDVMLFSTPTQAFRLADGNLETFGAELGIPPMQMYATPQENAAEGFWLVAGLKLYHVSNGRFELRYTAPAEFLTLNSALDGGVLCGLENGLLAEVPIRGAPRSSDFGPVVFNTVIQTRADILWLATRTGLFLQRGTNRRHFTSADGLSANGIASLFQDREGSLWVGTHGGGLQRMREKRVTVHSTQTGLKSNDAISVLQDRDGRVWVGTFGGGISVRSADQWESISFPVKAPDTYNIASLCQTHDGTIWIGGFGCPDFRRSDGVLEETALFDGDDIRAIFEDRDGGIWIGGETNGVAFRKGDWEIRYDTSKGLSRNQITAIAQDQSGAIWVGTRNGLNRISKETIARDSSRTDSLNRSSSPSSAVPAPSLPSFGGEGKNEGARFSGTITTFYQKDGLGADGVYSLWQDAEDTLWIGTMGGGLSRFKNGRFTTVTQKRGLLSDVIGQVIEDDWGNLWMGTPAGIVRARKQDLNHVLVGESDFVVCRLFGKNEGLDQSECAGGFQPACMKASDGTLWFCTIGGVVSIDPRSIPRNEIPPPVHIERVVMDERKVIPSQTQSKGNSLQKEKMRESRNQTRWGDTPWSPDSFRTPDSATDPRSVAPPEDSSTRGIGHSVFVEPVVVPAGTARIELQYTGLSMVAPERVRFRFWLEGYDTDWSPSETKRSAIYTHVPPGEYSFRVKAANNDGIWNETVAVLPLRVQAYYWQTMWFRLLTWVGVASLIGGALWARSRYLQRIQAVRVRIANDLHDEAGSNLGSICLLSRRLAKRLSSQPSAASEIAEIEQISRTTAEFIRTSVWLIDPQFDTLQQMLKAMEGFSARLFPDASCHCEWNVADLDRQLSLDLRQHFFLMFKEVLHNIHKHAQAHRVEIELSENQGHFLLRVRDDGVGFNPDAHHDGHGLRSLKDRAAQLSGTVQIDNQVEKGTSVTIRVKSTQTRG